jgi:hypothetical protein
MTHLKLTHGRPNAYQVNGDIHAHSYGPIFGPYPFYHARPDGLIEFGCEETERLHVVNGQVYYAGMFYAGWSVFAGPPLADEAVHLVPFDPEQAEPPEPLTPCECELPGEFCCGLPGILARLENGKVSDDFRVERCDLCQRYDSDAAARRKLMTLGLITGADPNLPTFTVHRYVTVRVRLEQVAARDPHDAARKARDLFDWDRYQADAEFVEEFTEIRVDADGEANASVVPSRRFNAELTEIPLSA